MRVRICAPSPLFRKGAVRLDSTTQRVQVGVSYSLKSRKLLRRKRFWISVTAGLIVFLLALAVIIPLTRTYTAVDGVSASVAEMQTVQTAIDAMMYDGSVDRITPSRVASNSWSNHPIGEYLRGPSTLYYYCWDASGAVTGQFESATPC